MDSDMITWQDGVGHLPGSDLKFRLNELGLVEVLEDEAWQKIYNQAESGLPEIISTESTIQNVEKTGQQVDIVKTEKNQTDSSCSNGDTADVKSAKNGEDNQSGLLVLPDSTSLSNGNNCPPIKLEEESTLDLKPDVNNCLPLLSEATGVSESVTTSEDKKPTESTPVTTSAEVLCEKKVCNEVSSEMPANGKYSGGTGMISISAPKLEDNNFDVFGFASREHNSDEESLPDIESSMDFKPIFVSTTPAKAKSVSPAKKPKATGNKAGSKHKTKEKAHSASPSSKKITTLTSHFEQTLKKSYGSPSKSPKKLPVEVPYIEEPFDPYRRDSPTSVGSEELPDIDPGPPCLRARSRSRSLSPAFHLPPPTKQSSSANLDGIPILKAESNNFQDKDIAFCKCCGCFGLAQEFYEFVFCTKACGDSYKYHSRSPDGKKKPSPTTPNKSKLISGGESSHHKNFDGRSNGGDASPSDKSGNKKKKKISSAAGKSKHKHVTVAKGKSKGGDANPATSSKNTKRLQSKVKSSSLQSKDRKRNFPLLLSKRMPGSPERKSNDSINKDMQLSPDITLGKSKVSAKASSYSVSSDFDWTKYLAETKSKSAPHRLFRQPCMPPSNPFRSGMMMESIDPQHQSLICATTVVEIQGYRLRLRFQDFSEAYDFWVNADSQDIFPIGWCDENNLELQPPPGAKEPFSWYEYLDENDLEAAPRHIFSVTKEDIAAESDVLPGMKMEAVDIRNQNLVCVATVAKVMGERILVHFDSWDSLYDYWTDLTSPYIHPVGWCEKNNVTLTPPNYCKSDFSWEKYLRATNTTAMPSRLFRPLPPVGFRKGCKVECVDKRNPFLIRVATISEVDQHNLIVHFDNWPTMYDYAVYELSPDIHPVGWCAHTGHPLQPPPPADGTWKGTCTTFGCIGLGHIRGPKFLTHNSEKNCPYALHNYKKDWILADRVTIFERNFGHPHTDNSSSVETAPNSETQAPVTVLANHAKVGKSSQAGFSKSSVPTKSAAVRRKRSSASTKEATQNKKQKIALATSTSTSTEPRTTTNLLVTSASVPRGSVLSEIKESRESTSFVNHVSLDEGMSSFEDNSRSSNKVDTVLNPATPALLNASVTACSATGASPTTTLTTPVELASTSTRQLSSPVPSTSGTQNNSESAENNSDTTQRRAPVPSTSGTAFPHTTTTSSEAEADYPPNYSANSGSLKSVIGTLNEATVSSWKVPELARFISTIPGCEHTSERFLDQLIDGESFLMLSQHDFINVMGLKLGPAIKLCNVIRMINFNTRKTSQALMKS